MVLRVLLLLALLALAYARLHVRAFGAIGDGITDDTAAIQSAISSCAALNGCTLVFSDGAYLTAPFNLTSNMVLEVHSSASILAITDVEAWPVVKPFPSYCQGREMPGPRYAPFVGGNNLTNVVIQGGGTIDGQGLAWWDRKRNGTLLHTRGRLVEFMYGEGIVIRNVTLKDSPFWTVHPYVCNNVLIEHVTILAPLSSPNTDGIDPDSSSNVVVRNCHIACGDDNISVKSGMDYCGREFNTPSTNITVEDCTMPWGDGLAVGSEMSGGVSNITFRNIIMGAVTNAARAKTGRGRGGVVDGVLYENISVLGAEATVFINMNYSKNPPTNRTATPVFKNFVMRNVRGLSGRAGSFVCLPESPCQMCFEDVTTHAPLPYSCQHLVGAAQDTTPQPCFQEEVPCTAATFST